MTSQNQNTLNNLRLGLHSSLRDQSSSKSVQQQVHYSKVGKSRHIGVLQQLKKRYVVFQIETQIKLLINKEDDWNDRFYVQQIPIFKQQSVKNHLRIQSTKVSGKNSNNSSKIQEVSFEPSKIRRVTQESVSSIQRPATSQFQYQMKSNENSGVVNRYIKELQTQGARPPSVNYSSTHPYPQPKLNILQENTSLVQQSQQVSDEVIRNLKIQINKLWEEFNIPDFHRMLYVECTKQFKKKQFQTIVQQEIQSLKDRKSFIQISLRALKARQQCLKTIREYIATEQENQQNLTEQSLYKFGELIVHLRILTLNIVESILRWRDYLSQLLFMSCKQKIQNILFLFQGDNYLLTLQNDYKFISESYLQNYFCFQKSTPDPFFLATQSTNNSYIANNPLKNEVLQRIRASELILLEERIYAKIEQKEKEMTVAPLGLFEDEAEDFITNYLKEIPIFINDSKKILESVKYEQELNWVKVCSNYGKLMQGLCIFYVDKNCFTQRRIIISHISSLSQENFSKALEKCVEYIWKNDYSDEIRITLHYQYDNNNDYKINQDIQNSLKQIGFKWKQMQSEKDTGLKSTIFGITRPQNIPKGAINLSNQEPISYKQISLLSETKLLDLPDLKYTSYDSSLLILSLLSKLKCTSSILQKLIQLSPKKNKQNQNFKNLQQKQFIAPGTREEKIQLNQKFKQTYDQIFDEKESSNYLSKLLNQNIVSDVSQTKLCYRWLNFHSFQLENYSHSYIRIKIDQQNQQFYIKATSPKSSQPIYLIPTDDKSIVVFIVSLKESEINQIKEGKLNQFVYEVINDSDKDQVKNDELWIPTFKKSMDFHKIPVEVEDKSNTNSSQILSKVMVSTQYQQPISASLQVKQPSQNACIIQTPFIFGKFLFSQEIFIDIQNLQIGLIKADDLDLPLLSCFIEESDLV